jgi:sterol desaturase/sphingolipid hydroxylase (fatty acid hydroxylase superfamily)
MIRLLIALGILSVTLIPLEALSPGILQQARLRRGWFLDLVYWFVAALITKPLAKVSVAVALLPLLLLAGAGSFEDLLQGHGPLGRQSPLAQVMQMIVLIDFVGYWLHRAFHSKPLWSFHVIHHSSVELDWLSAARVHPVNDIANKTLQAAIVVALGYAPILLAGALPFFTAYAIFQHANVTWDFGTLRAVFASSRFHRWHHTSAQAGRDKNFAGLLLLWDILFGTYYMPSKQPAQFGVDDPVPTNLVGQLLWPFRPSNAVSGRETARFERGSITNNQFRIQKERLYRYMKRRPSGLRQIPRLDLRLAPEGQIG